MSKNELNKNGNVFEKTFGDLLKGNEEKENAVVHQPEDSLEEALYGEEENPSLPNEVIEQAIQDYIPPSIGDEQWEEFVSRTPLPPMDRDQEARAVSIGLQEIRKMKEYMMYTHRHITNEFEKIYAMYPIAFAGEFEEHFGKAHKSIIEAMEDMENLIAGDIDRVEAVKNNYKLLQTFEEKRLSILYDLLEHYNNKRNNEKK
ncbi:hypothetical protein ABWK22_02015 [Gottfriedia acidiceleris]|uniref:hypothetical protein n=1 Tax=Gottfriedia acidiceleris TaxID=371036 RepID=UPI003396AFF7